VPAPRKITELTGELNISSVVSVLTGSLNTLTSPGGALHGVQVPTTDDQLEGATQGASQVDASGIAGAVEQMAGQILPLVAQIPGAGDLIRPVETALAAVEQITGGDLLQQLQDLADRFKTELSGPGEGGFLGTVERLLSLVQGAQELQGLIGLIRTVLGVAGGSLSGPAGKVLGAVPAAVGAARALAALMALESSLAEAERLTGVMKDQMSPETVNAAVAGLESAFGTGSQDLASFISALDTANPAEVDAATQAIQSLSRRLSDLDELLSRSLGFGEATLVHLDVTKMRAEVTQAAGVLSSVDMGPVRAAVQGLVDSLDPLLRLQPPAGPAMQLDALLDFLHDKAEDIADAVTAMDFSVVTDPLTKGLTAVTAPVEKVAEALDRVVASIRSALETVRQAVASLPFDSIVHTVQSVLAPVNQVLDFIGDLVDHVEDALHLVVPPVQTGIANAEKAIDDFKRDVLGVLDGAADLLDELQLDQVIGKVADNVRGLANTIAQAQMTPYFDTAVDVIGTTADVFEALPLDLLPDNIKQEVDAAAAPIRAIDVEGVKTTVEGWFQIDPDTGAFLLRGPLMDAVSDLQDKYDQLVAQVKVLDPRTKIPDINNALGQVGSAIDEFVPKLSLQPVQDAIDQVKGALDDFDLHALLQPVDDAFAEILTAVDQYSPAALIAPLEARVTAARQQVIDTIKLDQWGPSVDALVAQAKALGAKLDVDLLKVFTAAMAEANALFERAPDFRLGSAFGALFSSLLQGAGLRIHPWTFDVVLGWLEGDGGVSALTGRAERTAAAVEATLAEVQALDLQGLLTRLGTRAQALRDAVGGLPAGAAKTTLTSALTGLDLERRLGALSANRQRYLGLLQDAAAESNALRSVGLSAVDVAMEGLGAAFAPLQRVRDFIKSLFRMLGIPGLDGSLKDAVRGVLAILTPERLAGIFTPVLDAARARVNGLLDQLAAPIQAGIADVQQIVADFDLQPLQDGLQAVYLELRGKIASLAPGTVLAPTLSSFDDLKAKLLAFNPLLGLQQLIDDLVAAAHRVLGKLSGEELLEAPIRIYDDVIKALEALNLESLLDPVLDALDSIGAQIDTGLDRTAEALERLQQALPAPGSGSSSGGSVSVG